MTVTFFKVLVPAFGIGGIIVVFVWPGALLLKNLQWKWRNLRKYLGVNEKTCPKCGASNQIGLSTTGAFWILYWILPILLLPIYFILRFLGVFTIEAWDKMPWYEQTFTFLLCFYVLIYGLYHFGIVQIIVGNINYECFSCGSLSALVNGSLVHSHYVLLKRQARRADSTEVPDKKEEE